MSEPDTPDIIRRTPVTVHHKVDNTYLVEGYHPNSIKPFLLESSFETLDDDLYNLGLVAC